MSSPRKVLEDIFVMLCGLVTAHAVVLLVFLAHKYLKIAIFTFGFWGGLIPAGAIFCGFGAASGYYYASLHFQHKPTKFLLLSMILVAVETQVLIYLIRYYMARYVTGEHVSASISFFEYLKWDLSQASYKSISGGNHGTLSHVGWYGYLLATIQFLGFMLGAASIYFHLVERLEKNSELKAACNDKLSKVV